MAVQEEIDELQAAILANRTLIKMLLVALEGPWSLPEIIAFLDDFKSDYQGKSGFENDFIAKLQDYIDFATRIQAAREGERRGSAI